MARGEGCTYAPHEAHLERYLGNGAVDEFSTVKDLTPSLVARLRQGDGQAGELLEEVYRAPILRFCKSYLRHDQDAEDAAQDVFFKVLASDRYPDNFRSWLYRIARNHCLNVLRHRAVRQDQQPMKSQAALEAYQTGHLTRMLNQEMQGMLKACVDSLPAMYREVLILRYGENFARSEIAEILDIPESFVKSRLFDGMQRIRKELGAIKAAQSSEGGLEQ